jgi:hypothetical protein
LLPTARRRPGTRTHTHTHTLPLRSVVCRLPGPGARQPAQAASFSSPGSGRKPSSCCPLLRCRPLAGSCFCGFVLDPPCPQPLPAPRLPPAPATTKQPAPQESLLPVAISAGQSPKRRAKPRRKTRRRHREQEKPKDKTDTKGQAPHTDSRRESERPTASKQTADTTTELPKAEAPDKTRENGKGERRSIGRENARDSSRGRKKRDRQRKAHHTEERDKGQDPTQGRHQQPPTKKKK